ncbi:hypothetical protein PLICRDRAFT_174398 [Plicaturopsis crispa FD-325 SS-3]|nr:hypothetical protein PLICRDRAFT_174398 [Plicaturopsis crispa FD-325 SS-3]
MIDLVQIINHAAATDAPSWDYRAMRTLDMHPHLKAYVRVIRQHAISSTVMWDPAKLSTLPNLRSYTLYSPPSTPIHSQHFTPIVTALLGCRRLVDVHLLFSIYSYNSDALVSLRTGTRALSLGKPSRDSLENLSRWDGLGALEYLRILDGTKIEPSTFHPLALRLGNLQSFVLGDSHKLPCRVLNEVLQHMPNLRHLDLFYDNFLNFTVSGINNSRATPLPHLRALIIRHQGVAGLGQYNDLFNWISSLISASPSQPVHSRICGLRELTLISDDGKSVAMPPSLIDLLPCVPHLRKLDAPRIEVRSKHMANIWKCCPEIQEMCFRVEDANMFMVFYNANTNELDIPAKHLHLLSWPCDESLRRSIPGPLWSRLSGEWKLMRGSLLAKSKMSKREEWGFVRPRKEEPARGRALKQVADDDLVLEKTVELELALPDLWQRAL